MSPAIEVLDDLGLIEIEPGPRLVNEFRLSNRWRTIDEIEAARLAALAREVKPHRTFEKRREPKPVKPTEAEAHDGRASARHAAAGAVTAAMPWQVEVDQRPSDDLASGRPASAVRSHVDC